MDDIFGIGYHVDAMVLTRFSEPSSAGTSSMVDFNSDRFSSVGAREPRSRRRSSRTRVYIADDQVLVRRGLASLIRGQNDMELCGEASNFAVACVEIRDLQPDVVILEPSIEGAHGFGRIESFKATGACIQIIVFSLLDEDTHAMLALKAGARGYLSKEAAPAVVLDAIRRAHAGEIVVSESVAGQISNQLAIDPQLNSFTPSTSLTSREIEIFQLIGSGKSTRTIADSLKISSKTVEAHRAHIKEKANLNSGFELLCLAMKWSGADIALPA
jgi:DNA-binding NarL/FixJ family response regulator